MQIYKNSLVGRVALVTGAGSGIGRATAKLLAYAGARVGVLTRDPAQAEETCHEIRDSHGGEAIPLVADVADTAAMEAAFQQLHRTWQRLDIVVANAGVNGLWAPLEEITPEEWDKTIDINLKGTYLTVRGALPFLKVAGGAVVIVASINGTRIFSNSGASAYATSKAGQRAFARMVALETAKHGIRINTVCPGAIETNIDENTHRQHLEEVRQPVEFPSGSIPLTGGKPGTSGQVAQLIWFLVSDASNHITGTEVYIDGGQSLLQG